MRQRETKTKTKVSLSATRRPASWIVSTGRRTAPPAGEAAAVTSSLVVGLQFGGCVALWAGVVLRKTVHCGHAGDVIRMADPIAWHRHRPAHPLPHPVGSEIVETILEQFRRQRRAFLGDRRSAAPTRPAGRAGIGQEVLLSLLQDSLAHCSIV